ncbi:MAG: protocatechuate 3,4-dioxygenase subunit alpha [Hyphomicrobiales bacterium]|nr:protocatechuate 3,4-dioxygenase subunit alpha [Hyphomicrobiales bacterium]MCP5001313.1 protocatechuate 3,4-dioxygenase subunit alpha [Hyphomicrobiales bacterium]
MHNTSPETGAFFVRDRNWHPKGLTPDYKTSVLRSPQKALLSLRNTVSEITGPVFGHDMPTDMETGIYSFDTIKPGRVPFPDGRLQAPHVSFWIVARGINLGLNTRMYFVDEKAANDEDPVLAMIEHRVRVPTLLAERDGDTYRFDIHLQGENETIFFDI